MTVVGIDLGTTNSAIAYLKDGKPAIIENVNGHRTTPSVFQINQNGEIVIGQEAKDTYATLTDQTVMEVKRLMGTDKKVTVAGKEYRPEEISAYILKYLKSAAEDKLGKPVTEAVVTVPAYFSDSQRKATQKAGEIAGLKVERIINEPTAAALAFGIENMDKDQHILVYDLGGGTFDVSVVEMFEGVIEVKASAGNNHLGGMDFDNAIVDWVAEKFEQENGYSIFINAEESEQLSRTAKLKDVAEKAKKILSSQMSTRIQIPFLGIHNNAPIGVDYEITRADFEKIIKEKAQSTLVEVDKALADAKLSQNDIQEILLVGGSTRIPLIQELVEKKFNRTLRKDVNPDEAIALGASVQGAIKSGEIEAKDGLMVIDVCPYTLGTEIVKDVGGQVVPGYFDPIIPRNSTIPISETKRYYTAYDNQDVVVVNVYQGEDQYVKNNIFLSDDIVLENIPKRQARMEAIDVTFTYDINGMLQVEAKVLSTGLVKKEAIQSQAGVMSDVETAASVERVNEEWDQSALYQEVKNVMYRAEKMLDEVDPANKVKIEQLLQQLKTALTNDDTAGVKRYEEELTDLLIELV
ncbi:Hsp70 family protein [Evansella cellulosilytica]|uniref:Chaperone protein DnaK n=1 Tax=Evansella cellulosilytica (strain ATCC 21833 / DSM 2522 / FERM P-1141 / JCM 9156 / N-4) TaxID=649639 RepID=E6TT44_EVAC2|nr:Hsp70 family protein [Evansella cellulosilytica]ADU31952.1 Heat shock protein 70 [Evansella cellulosilytica DSM 2522]